MEQKTTLLICLSVLLGLLGLETTKSVEGGLIEGRKEYEALRNYQSGLLEEAEEDNEIPRAKRDVLKGMDRDLVRTKRYIGRVPLSYMKKAILPDEMIQPYPMTTNDDQVYIQPGDERNLQNSARFKSHFRDNNIEGLYHIPLSTNNNKHHQLYFGGGSSSFTKPILTLTDELESLSDEEIEKLLRLLDGQDEISTVNSIRNKKTTLQSCDETDQSASGPVERSRGQGGNSGHRWTPEQIQAIMDMYIRPRMGMGKRETGKRSPRTFETFEQPMSFDNALYSEGDPVEFLSDKRSKRVGTRDLIAKATALNRFKKETDPAVLASLNEAFNINEAGNPSNSAKNLEHAPIMESSPVSASENNDRPKSKKDIDWSNYFGVDKRSNNNEKAGRETSTPSSTGRNTNNNAAGEIKSQKGGSISSPLAKTKSHLFASNGVPAASMKSGKEAKEAIQKAEKKKENEVTHKKEEDEKDWILEQFYKNLAMSTNVKRKRESPGKPSSELDKLEELEKKMAEAGDKIIWDALKYTGSHRDESLSPQELAQVKSNIISKLSTAYSLEKVREAVDELREQLTALEKKAD